VAALRFSSAAFRTFAASRASASLVTTPTSAKRLLRVPSYQPFVPFGRTDFDAAGSMRMPRLVWAKT
jgi:hypothetical protein